MLKQEPASRGVGIPVLQGGEDVNLLYCHRRWHKRKAVCRAAKFCEQAPDRVECLSSREGHQMPLLAQNLQNACILSRSGGHGRDQNWRHRVQPFGECPG